MANPSREAGFPPGGDDGKGTVKVCLKCRSTFRTRRDTCPKDGAALVLRDLPPGSILAGKYRILKQIGQGGMGVVYSAEHIIMGKTVAIKVIHPLLSSQPQFLEMFRAEARMSATFSHENVLTVHDFGESDGRFYLVMELLEGQSLKNLLKEVKRLPPERAFGILVKVCSAVAAAHNAGIIHLDIKGENVYIDEGPNEDNVKVLDFGLAQLAGSHSTRIGDEMTIGTVGYMAPEQIMGGLVDRSTDVYAIGVMAFEMLTGQLPFLGERKQEILQSQIQGRLRKWPKTRVLKVVPKEARYAIMSAIDSDPGRRPQSVRELGRIFEKSLQKLRSAAGVYRKNHGLDVRSAGPEKSLLSKIKGSIPFLHPDHRGPEAPEGMTYVPAGDFLMGSNLGSLDERPGTKMPCNAFFIDVVPVTNLEYAKFVQETDHRPPSTWKTLSFPPGTGELPVTGVSWDDAVDYAKWAGKRLPTEVEWEKAARGTDGRVYPWGNKWDPQVANWGGNPRFYGGATIKPAGSFPQDKSPYGCLDMAGNVKQWTASWYKPYGPTDFKTNDFGEKFRVVRGGSCLSIDKKYLRCSNRSHASPDERGEIGFRCAKDIH